MTRKLEMVFNTDQGKNVSITLADPKADLTRSAVEAAMAKIIEKSAFVSKNGKFTSVKEINIQTNDKVALS